MVIIIKIVKPIFWDEHDPQSWLVNGMVNMALRFIM